MRYTVSIGCILSSGSDFRDTSCPKIYVMMSLNRTRQNIVSRKNLLFLINELLIHNSRLKIRKPKKYDRIFKRPKTIMANFSITSKIGWKRPPMGRKRPLMSPKGLRWAKWTEVSARKRRPFSFPLHCCTNLKKKKSKRTQIY